PSSDPTNLINLPPTPSPPPTPSIFSTLLRPHQPYFDPTLPLTPSTSSALLRTPLSPSTPTNITTDAPLFWCNVAAKGSSPTWYFDPIMTSSIPLLIITPI
ncbi:unnamed protein product, partial [Laminaria digitata]